MLKNDVCLNAMRLRVTVCIVLSNLISPSGFTSTFKFTRCECNAKSFVVVGNFEVGDLVVFFQVDVICQNIGF